MNIIADTSSVACIIIISKNLHSLFHAGCNFHYTWQKVLRVLLKAADFSIRIITGSIEISQSRKAHSLKLVIPGHKAFNFKLSKSVVIFRILWMIFIHRKIFRSTKNCSRRRENHFFAAIFYSGIHNINCSGNIVYAVFFRFFHRLTGSLKSSKVNKCIKALGKSSFNICLNQNVSINKAVLWKKIAAKSA